MFTTIDCSNHTFESTASIEVYDITGKMINNLESFIRDKKIILEKKQLVPGLYFYRLYDGEVMLDKGKIIILL